MERHYIEFKTPETVDIIRDQLSSPADDEVLISVHHAGINRADLLQRLGLYPPPADASPVPPRLPARSSRSVPAASTSGRSPGLCTDPRRRLRHPCNGP